MSLQEHPEFEDLDLQVAVVNYEDVSQLRYTLQGVDLLISTISGPEQLNLIDAARRARVCRFVPSEFEGALGQRPEPDDPLDRGSQTAMAALQQCARSSSHPMRCTVFSCGIFYERFAPGGLRSFNMGASHGIESPGSYLVNIGAASAEIGESNAQGQPAWLSMTSASDVARFLAAAIELGPDAWPRELRMRGDQLTVHDLVGVCATLRSGKPYDLPPIHYPVLIGAVVPFDVVAYSFRDLQSHLEYYRDLGDWDRWRYFQNLIATASGRYYFNRANLNDMVEQSDVVEVVPTGFRDWLWRAWSEVL